MIRLRFLGAAGTVTGSRYVIDYRDHRFLVDCGLFQGPKEIRVRNWEDFPVDPSTIEALVLTHAHIDHSGYLPKLGREGFRGRILCTAATADLCSLLLPDSAHLQEEEASFMNRHRLSKHRPALPLYSIVDAHDVLRRFQPVPYHQGFEVVPGVTATLYDAGHILGSARVELTFAEDPPVKLVLSGDVGRKDVPILKDPEPLEGADYLVLESTYGDRLHGEHPIEENLARVVWETIRRRGVMVIPAFAIERTQEILYLLAEVARAGDIPTVPVFIDSPMAVRATRFFQSYPEYYDEEARALLDAHKRVLSYPRLKLCETVAESKSIRRHKPPFIVISASGMATGGRVLHHLRDFLPDRDNMVLLVGYQSVGTRGWRLKQGEDRVKIFGEWVPVKARVETLDGFSGHADWQQIMEWVQGMRPPRRTFLTHGEPEALEAQRARLSGLPGWNVHVPAHLEEVELT